jgi:hypothetical protein
MPIGYRVYTTWLWDLIGLGLAVAAFMAADGLLRSARGPLRQFLI